MALLKFDETTAAAVASSEEFIASVHAIDQLIVRWQKNPDEWNQLLLEVFGRSEAVDLTGITIEIFAGQTMAGLYGAYAPIGADQEERIYLMATGWKQQVPSQFKLFSWKRSALPLTTGSTAKATHPVMKGLSFQL